MRERFSKFLRLEAAQLISITNHVVEFLRLVELGLSIAILVLCSISFSKCPIKTWSCYHWLFIGVIAMFESLLICSRFCLLHIIFKECGEAERRTANILGGLSLVFGAINAVFISIKVAVIFRATAILLAIFVTVKLIDEFVERNFLEKNLKS